MNNNNKNNTTRELLFIGSLITLLFVSCMGISWVFEPKTLPTSWLHGHRHLQGKTISTSKKKHKPVHAKRPLPRPHVTRAVILENGTVTYCKLNSFELTYLHPLDTVWINPNTHTIDDTSANTMQAVLNPAKF